MEVQSIIKSSSSGRTKFVETIYFDDSMSYKSRAAYVLLKEYLKAQDEDYIALMSPIFDKVYFSRNYLTKEKELKGDLVCFYCGKPHLQIEYEGMVVPEAIKATVDHIIPVSKGGDRTNPKNINVACAKCNTNKGDKDLSEYLKSSQQINYIKLTGCENGTILIGKKIDTGIKFKNFIMFNDVQIHDFSVTNPCVEYIRFRRFVGESVYRTSIPSYEEVARYEKCLSINRFDL